MGAEQLCTAHHNNRVSEGKGHLDATHLTFRGTFKLDLPLSDLGAATVDGAMLVVETPDGVLKLDLGPNASRWADKINNPRSRLDKLGVRSGALVSTLDLNDPEFLRELSSRAGVLYSSTPREPVDVMFLRVEQPSDLTRVLRLRWYLKRDGALWTLRTRGSKLLPEEALRTTMRGAGLVDVKVCAFSDTLTADKFVFRRAAP